MPVHRKLYIEPSDIRLMSTPAPLATLAEFQAYLGTGDVDTANIDAGLLMHLNAASEFVQGPFSVTRQCFTDHDLEAEYPTHVWDLFLPGGPVKAGTTVTVTRGRATLDRIVIKDQQAYARMTASAEGPATLTWTAARATVPALIKESCLRLAAHYWIRASGGESEAEALDDAGVRDQLMRAGWV